MTTIGDDSTPGIQSTVDTQDTIDVNDGAAYNGVLVGPADLGEGPSKGDAEPNTLEAFRRPGDVREAFGEDSQLTQNIMDALGEGTAPVYGVATELQEVTEVPDTGLTSAPATENPEDYDSVDTIVLTYDEPVADPPAGEIHINPVTGDTSGVGTEEVTYLAPDYSAALEYVAEEAGDLISYIGPVQENADVTQKALNTVNNMESFGDLAIAVCGLAPDTAIAADMELPYDASRLQVVFPARNADDESTIGSVVGKKASLGLNRSAMGTSLDTQGRMRQRISVDDEIDLINNNVVPISSATGGAQIVDDPTTVTDENSEEAGLRQGYGRIVMDTVIELVHAREEPFIGKLNSPANRNALNNILNSGLANIREAQAIQEYHVVVQERDAMSVQVDVTVDTTAPLRNIYNDITAGRVLNN